VGLPRKNGKSSLLSALALYFASIEGEHAPDVIVAEVNPTLEVPVVTQELVVADKASVCGSP
jgi:hypothetical protein